MHELFAELGVENQMMPKRIPFAAEAIFVSSILLGVLVALFASPTVLTDSPALSTFTDFMASLVPGIDRLAKVSSFPEVTRFTSAVLWASVPVQALLCFYPGVFVTRFDLLRKKKTFGVIAWMTCPLLIAMPAFIPEPKLENFARTTLYNMALRSVSEDRLWLGVLGGVVAISTAFFIFAFVAWWPRTWAVYFGSENKER